MAVLGTINSTAEVATLTGGKVPTSELGTGVADNTTFLRGDQTWQTPPGGGGGDAVTVNGAALVDADLDDATPAAPAGGVNVKWQKDGGSPANVSAHLAANDVANTVMADMAGNTVKANAAAGAGDPSDLAIPANTVLGRKGGDIVAETVATAQVGDDQITYAKMQDVSAASRLLGRGSAGGAGNVEEITLGAGLAMTGTALDTAGGGMSLGLVEASVRGMNMA